MVWYGIVGVFVFPSPLHSITVHALIITPAVTIIDVLERGTAGLRATAHLPLTADGACARKSHAARPSWCRTLPDPSLFLAGQRSSTVCAPRTTRPEDSAPSRRREPTADRPPRWD